MKGILHPPASTVRRHNVGIKFNRRFDVIWMEKNLVRAWEASGKKHLP